MADLIGELYDERDLDELLKALVTSGDLPVEDIIEALAPVLPSDIDAEGYVRRFLG